MIIPSFFFTVEMLMTLREVLLTPLQMPKNTHKLNSFPKISWGGGGVLVPEPRTPNTVLFLPHHGAPYNPS